MKTNIWLAALFVALAAQYGAAVAKAQDTLKVNSDTVRLKLENDRVRVLESTLPPGTRERMHSHPQYVV
jgi:quercetin dioxygenase-like cupin family protein